ncbi:MAG: PIN domain-containing protein [Stackebrandtia sp.]
MIGLDTNVLVRYIAQDDKTQSAKATELIESLTESKPGYLTMIVMEETYWVLRRAYKVDKKRASEILGDLLTAQEVVVEQAEAVSRALRQTADGADFADALISQLCNDAGCDQTFTFDQGAAARAGMRLLR